ncbi:unnamed protein product [Hermetia illucens]|uniref:Uncharacterized protein n=2 Tax=Hermetia illucens TaxID=343691 RepID=A0A7R8YL40_HERIL|nr:unnamed protein product [Hermetia illucens]
MASGGLVLVFLLIVATFGSTIGLRKTRGRGLTSTVSPERQIHPDKELQLVHLVYRHGPRTPADTYPNDPYFNETFSPVGWGQITNGGKRTLYKIGQWLRKRYDTFLGRHYMPDLLHAQATGVSRTHMSLATVLSGMWPPKNTPMEWNRALNWQPIPIYSQALDEDTLLLVRTSCPRYYEAVEEVLQLPEVKSVIDKYRPMMKQLEKITGMKIKTPEDVGSLFSTLKAEQEYGLELPPWTKEYFPDKLIELSELSYIYNVYTDELQRVKGGPFLKKMFKEWVEKRDNKLSPKDRKLFIYTGHDSTVVNILSALKIWEQQYPVYAIMSMFELYKDKKTGEYGVEVYLRNTTAGEPTPLTIPGCTFHCPLDKVIELAQPIVKEEASCTAKNSEFTEPPPSGP